MPISSICVQDAWIGQAGGSPGKDETTATMLAVVAILVPNTCSLVDCYIPLHPRAACRAGVWTGKLGFCVLLHTGSHPRQCRCESPDTCHLPTEPPSVVQGKSAEQLFGAKQPDFIFPLFKHYKLLFLVFMLKKNKKRKTTTTTLNIFVPCRAVHPGWRVHLHASLRGR